MHAVRLGKKKLSLSSVQYFRNTLNIQYLFLEIS